MMTPEVKLLGVTQPLMVDVCPYDGCRGQVGVNPGLNEPLDLIEFAGRWDYGPKSVAKMGDRDIIRRWIRSGEESMLEIVNVVYMFTCTRVVSHELVRHRIASYQQESQRYVKYDEESAEDLFFVPPEIERAGEGAVALYLALMDETLSTYNRLKGEYGLKSQIARYVLPNSTRTRIIVNMNLRELRHVFRLRMHSSAQPEFRAIATELHDLLLPMFPEVFEDIKPWLEAGERAAR